MSSDARHGRFPKRPSGRRESAGRPAGRIALSLPCPWRWPRREPPNACREFSATREFPEHNFFPILTPTAVQGIEHNIGCRFRQTVQQIGTGVDRKGVEPFRVQGAQAFATGNESDTSRSEEKPPISTATRPFPVIARPRSGQARRSAGPLWPDGGRVVPACRFWQSPNQGRPRNGAAPRP